MSNDKERELDIKDLDLPWREFKEKYPKRSFFREKIGEYCVSIFRRNGYRYSCNGCVLNSFKNPKGKCNRFIELPIKELELLYEKILEDEDDENIDGDYNE